jgi:hypothetical protein
MTEKVKKQILAIRDTGLTNMFDIPMIQRLAYERDFFELVTYLEENRKGYVHYIMTGEDRKEVSMAEEIRVLLVEPMKQPRLVTVEHTLENLQRLVEGYIEAVYPWNDPVGVVCDEEGIANRKEPNRLLMDDNGNPYDILKGTFFICGLGAEDFCSISDELAEKYAERFRWPEMFSQTQDGHVLWIRLEPGAEPRIIF